MMKTLFRNFIELHRGYDLPKNKRISGDFPIVSSTGIVGKHNSYKVKGPGVITGRSGTIGKVIFEKGCFWPLNTTLFVSDFKGNDPKYVYYWLQCFDLKHYTTGSTVPTLNRNDLSNLIIDVPTINEQRKRREILEILDAKIATNIEISQQLESMAKTIYDYWFLQFEFPDKDGKPYKSNGGKMIWNDQLKQEIPEGWKVSIVENILGDYPKTKTIKSQKYDQGSIYPIIDQSEDNYICGYTDDKTKVLELKDAIVFGDHSNVSKYINFPFARGADGTQILNSNTPRLPNYLLYQEIISLPEIEKGYSRHFKFLKMQSVILPTLNISQKYMDTVKSMLSKQRQISYENKELKSLRDFLLPLLINGQVTVSD